MKVGPRTNMGHQWYNTGERAECVWCMCSPLDQQAKEICDRFVEAQYYDEVDHIPKEGSDE